MNHPTLLRAVAVLLLAVSAVACSPVETQKAEQALVTWRNKRPVQYTYVLEPTGGSNPGQPVRLKVESENVLEAMGRDGRDAKYRDLSMTGLLEQALDIADEDSFSGSYDDELGYVKSFFYSPGPGGYGFDVPCFEASLDESACAEQFRVETPEP